MGFEIQRRSPGRQINPQQRRIPLQEIIAVQGQNPLATGIEEVGKQVGAALTKRAELQRQGRQLAQFKAITEGQDLPTGTGEITPEMYGQAVNLRETRNSKKTDRAKLRADYEITVEKLRTGWTERDPLTGKETVHPGVKGISVKDDADGNPSIVREADYSPGLKPIGTGIGGRGTNPTSKGVTPDGRTVSFNPRTQQNETPGGVPYNGPIFPTTVGTEEQRRQALVVGAQQSINDIKQGLTPGVLTELKAIRLTPGRAYSQLASPEAKRLYINLREAIANELYLKTGATMNEAELENQSISYLAALNDNPQDFLMRMDLLKRNIDPFSPRNPLHPFPPSPTPAPGGGRIRVKNLQTGQTGTISEGAFDPAKYQRVQ